MKPEGFDALLHDAVADVAVQAPVAEIIAAGRRRVRRRRIAGVLVSVAAVVAVVVAVPIGVAARHVEAASGALPQQGCPATLEQRLLPEWARSGFADPQPRSQFVLGEGGRIMAILWAPGSDPALFAPPHADRTNKILWVPRDGEHGGPLTIVASLGSTTVVRTVDAIGPSTVDLPEPGCWSLRLQWPGGSDTMWLRYAPGR